MNIQGRLKKIETKKGEHPPFCLCYGRFPKLEVLPMEIEEWKRRADAGEATEIILPDVCEKCRKRVDKSGIETTFEQFQQTVKSRVESAVANYQKHME